jgi:drug/metabolite transporter (DMT)-like permease
MTGLIAMFAALVCWGVWGFCSSQAVKGVHPLAIQWLYSIPYGVMMPLWYWLGRGERSANPPQAHNIYWALLACTISIGASYLFGLAMKHERASVVIGVTSAYPLVTIMLLIATGSETVRWQHVVGGILIVAGVALVQMSPDSGAATKSAGELGS